MLLVRFKVLTLCVWFTLFLYSIALDTTRQGQQIQPLQNKKGKYKGQTAA